MQQNFNSPLFVNVMARDVLDGRSMWVYIDSQCVLQVNSARNLVVDDDRIGVLNAQSKAAEKFLPHLHVIERKYNEFLLRFTVGDKSFLIGPPSSTRKDAEWMLQMFNEALRNAQQEVV